MKEKMKKTMRHSSTGSMVRTFHCEGCKQIKIVNREDVKYGN
jgi:hypothetical protein